MFWLYAAVLKLVSKPVDSVKGPRHFDVEGDGGQAAVVDLQHHRRDAAVEVLHTREQAASERVARVVCVLRSVTVDDEANGLVEVLIDADDGVAVVFTVVMLLYQRCPCGARL